MPAEWAAQSRVWVSRPHRAATWPGCLEPAQRQFDHFVELMGNSVEVCDTGRHGIATDDSWIRDYGPIFVLNGRNELTCHDFRFNSWGCKYPPWNRDDAVAGRIAQQVGAPAWRHEQVLEGGALDTNGHGTVLTTESCLLNTSRNPSLDRRGVERMLHDALGIRHVIWLPCGITGDDTDGHVDGVARFIGPATVAAVRAPEGHRDHEPLERNWRVLRTTRDQSGQTLNLVVLPVPRPIRYEFPDAAEYDAGRTQLPASYANFLICNGAVYVPTFGQQTDDNALRALDKSMPDHKIVPVPCNHLIAGLGAIHCLTMQQPQAKVQSP